MSTVGEHASVLVFDLGGVACQWLPDRRLAALSGLSGLPPGTIDQLVFDSGFDDAGERGQFSPEAFATELANMLGVDTSPASTVALRQAWAQAYEPLPSLLRVVRSAACRTALFTNNGPLLEQSLAHELSVVGEVFDDLLLSWRTGAAKPDDEAFRRATTVLGVAPDQVLFFDDSEPNVAAARAFGWRAHRFTTVLDVQATLATWT